MVWPRRDVRAGALTEECEAFLAGRYVECCAVRRDVVPVWAWMNLLAHGTEEQLRRAVSPGPDAHEWEHARSYVVGELLDLADAGRIVLAEFQREVLVPLELDVISCPSASGWQPGQLAAGLLGAFPTRTRQRR